MQVLKDSYNFNLCAQVLVDEADQPIGIPFACISDVFGGRLVSMPFSDFCDPLATSCDQWQMLSEAMIARGLPITIRPVHTEYSRDDQHFAQVKQAKWHGIDIAPDLDAIWKRNDEATRRAINRAKRDGVSVTVRQDREAMAQFFEMHLGIRKYKYKMVAQPWPFFENIWNHWLAPGNGAIMLASHGDQSIAATLVLKWKNTLYYKFNASRRDQLGLRPNDLIIWEIIQYAKTLGCKYVDLGLSDWDQEGLLRFKRKYATEEKTISFMRHTPDTPTANPHEKQLRELMGALTNLFTDEGVSDAISKQAGNLLYRYFV